MEQTVSKYVNNALASKKKHVYARLLDYFLTFVVAYLVFTIVLPISMNFSVVEALYAEISKISHESILFVGDTHLQLLNEDSTSLVDVNTTGANYLISLAKTNAYLYNLPYPVKQEDGTYVDGVISKEETFINDLTNYPLDNVSFYFKKYKKSEASLNDYTYEGVDYQNDIDTYLYKKIMEVDETKYSSDEVVITKGEGLSKYLILSEDNASLLIKKVAKSESTTTIDDLYNYLLGSYIKAIQYGINEVETKSANYLEISDRFNASYQRLAKALLLIYIVSYLIGYLLLIFIPRLIFKEYRSVGQKVMGIARCDLKNMSISWWQHLAYYLVDVILLFTSSLLAFVFIGMFGVTAINVFPHITLLAILLFILTFNIVSLFMPLVNKNRFDIPRLFARITLKDVNEYDVPVGMEASDENGVVEDGK